MSGENVVRSLEEILREAADRMEDGHYVQAPPMLRQAADTIDALRAEQNELHDDVKNLTSSVDSLLAMLAARDATIEELRAALVQGFDLLSDAALTAMCADVPSHDTIGKMTKWAKRAAALLEEDSDAE